MKLETPDIIALFLGTTGFVISLIGLVLTPMLNIKSKRLEKRLEYRFLLFQKILELWEYTHKQKWMSNTVDPILFEINKLIQLYGYNHEIRLFREVIDLYNQYTASSSEENRNSLVLKFNSFFEHSFNTYRKEIVLEKLEQ